MEILTPAERIFCAIDTTDLNQAVELAETLKGAVGGFKLGKEFFTANGPDGVARTVSGMHEHNGGDGGRDQTH